MDNIKEPMTCAVCGGVLEVNSLNKVKPCLSCMAIVKENGEKLVDLAEDILKQWANIIWKDKG